VKTSSTFVTLIASGAAQIACATTYTLDKPTDTVVGEDQTVVTVYEDTLYDLAAKYSLGSEELIRVNPGVDPWLPGAGKTLVVPGRHILPPGPHTGIVVNLPEHRLYYYPPVKRHHLSREHRQDGLAHAARRHACHSEGKGSLLVSARIGAQGTRRRRRSPSRGGEAGT
jgi:LysM repeat protein